MGLSWGGNWFRVEVAVCGRGEGLRGMRRGGWCGGFVGVVRCGWSAFGGGGVSSFAYDFVNAQEVQVTVAGGMGETDRGGPAFNIIPKTGGNLFAGTAFGSTAGKWSQGS